jgi:hypothetical protein
MRRAPWEEIAPILAALVRCAEDAREDVLETARSLLLHEVTSQVTDTVRGAALMGVTVRTYRRWTQELSEVNGSSLPARPLAPAL